MRAMVLETETLSPSGLARDAVDLVADARHPDPFSVLGPHAFQSGEETLLSIRTFVPGATSVVVLPAVDGPAPVEAKRLRGTGFFEAVLGPVGTDFRYRLRIEREEGHSWECEDTYRFGRVLTDYDLYLLGEGSCYRNYEKLGAHPMEIDGVAGVHFGVWAPNAERVSVVGPFNDWDGRRSPMRNLSPSGVWEVFIPDIAEGDLYKFEIRARSGKIGIKSDPYAFRFEERPATASVVHHLDQHEWKDDEWMREGRQRRNALDAPQAVYEVHLGSWMRGDGDRVLTYRELAEKLVPYVTELGFTHIELMPILEHPFDGSWGYQTLGYFAPTSRFGSPEDFAAFVDACHQADIGVILDWVPAHFPRDDHGLRLFDGTHLYEHSDPRQGEHKDWGTLIFNYSRNEVRNFLLGSALFWLEHYHLDGIRVDAVASMLYNDYSREEGEWVPNEYGGRENLDAIGFLKKLNELCHEHHPGVLTIAEESTAWGGVSQPTYLGGLGFSLKWNMGWMNDTLSYFEREPVHRKYHHHSLTFSLLYAFTENFMLPFSHDEVVHGKQSLLGKMPGDAWQKFANLRVLLALQYAHPGKKLLFMGCEFGQGQEWNFDQSLDWHLLDIDLHQGVKRLVADLNRMYASCPALHELDFDWQGFEWIDCQSQENSTLAFIRRSKTPGEEIVAAANFTPVPRMDHRVGVPSEGFYREILNTDSAHYGGGNIGNSGGIEARPEPAHGRPWSVKVQMPPLSMILLQRE